MAKSPGLIRRRGRGWLVVLRVNGDRHQFGPRREKFLGLAESKSEVTEWAWGKLMELEAQAKRKAQGLRSAVSFSELLKRYREEELPVLAPGTRDAYEDTFKPAEAYFVTKLGDPTLEQIQVGHIAGRLGPRRPSDEVGKG